MERIVWIGAAMSLQGFRFLNHGEFALALPPEDIGLSPRDRVRPNLSRARKVTSPPPMVNSLTADAPAPHQIHRSQPTLV